MAVTERHHPAFIGSRFQQRVQESHQVAKLTLRADFANIVDRPASCQTELSLLPMVQFWGLDKQESFSD